MAIGLLKPFRMFGCAHQFSWPRQLVNGQSYQVCLVCGAEYLYDWDSMRRGNRIASRRKAAMRRERAWQPRARRLAVEVSARFRLVGVNGDWCEATVRNISKSGVLIQAERLFALNSELEIVFDVPRELCLTITVGNRVAVQGRVVRLDSDRHRMGVAVFDWAASASGLAGAR